MLFAILMLTVQVADGVNASGTLRILRLRSDCGRRVWPSCVGSSGAHARAATADTDNRVGDVGAAALAEGLKASKLLTELWLGEGGPGV